MQTHIKVLRTMFTLIFFAEENLFYEADPYKIGGEKHNAVVRVQCTCSWSELHCNHLSVTPTYCYPFSCQGADL